MDFEQILLIAIAVLQIVDGRGMALRILRLLMQLVGENSNVQSVKKTQSKEVKSEARAEASSQA